MAKKVSKKSATKAKPKPKPKPADTTTAKTEKPSTAKVTKKAKPKSELQLELEKAASADLPADVLLSLVNFKSGFSFVDVGTGAHGVVGQNVWERLAGSLHVVSEDAPEMPPQWDTGLKGLVEGITFDVVQCCNYLHLMSKKNAQELLEAFKNIGKLVLVIVPVDEGWSTASFEDVGYAVVEWKHAFVIAAWR